MMVDISSKEDIGRYAEAIALSSTDRPDVCVQAAVKAVKNAYRYIPLLHPIPLQAAAHCNAGEIRAEAWTRWKTGVEMDALFGALVGAIASGSTEIKRLFVTLKVKGTDVKLDEGAAVEVSSITRPEVGYIARASGYIHLKSIDIIKQAGSRKAIPYARPRLSCRLVPRGCASCCLSNVSSLSTQTAE
ncbi:cyclic pyranopterin monophosphate synthase MoaC [Thermoproteus tenax]|nr:cyclic pyranopterin monophosphate synthase MoaC [Thermoproteus tenax]